ncbi:MAG: response regulator [Bacteroidales bacterium]|nr:response regulator [Bacteroidales bacterium]
MLDIIVIDDEPHAIKAIELITKEYCNFIRIVDKANLIEDGWKKIILHKPDIVILDLNMPRGSGFDLLERFPKRTFEVIIVSAYGDLNDYAKQKYKITEFLSKPIDIDELLRSLNRIKDIGK